VLHLDLDAFYAAVEQRDKPSLRGKPVIVGGLGPRGVVSTASYEARAFGVRSAMRMAEARARCPHAAYLYPRFHAYRISSRRVMAVLRELSPLVEPLSLDEAFVDLAASAETDLSVDGVERIGRELKAAVRKVTGGLTGSVGAGTSKFMAKVASDLRKPDGLVVVPPGTERGLLAPMTVSTIPGVGPATADRLRRVGVHTVAELDRLGIRPREVALDGGFEPTTTNPALPTAATVFIAGRQQPKSRRTKRRLARYRVGCEGRISHLKRGYGLRRARLKSHDGARTWVGWAALTYNLDTLAVQSA
jgi:hypothetical protein